MADYNVNIMLHNKNNENGQMSATEEEQYCSSNLDV